VKRLAGLLLLGFVLTSCRRGAQVEASPKTPAPVKPAGVPIFQGPPDDTAERANVLNLAHGGSVVSRTGDASLENSAIYAIDGDLLSAWLTPNGDPEQTVTVSLPYRTRISELGVARGASAANGFRALLVERSLDGVKFVPFTELRLQGRGGEQFFPVTPAEARFLRVTIREATGTFAQLNSLLARGTQLEPPAARSLDGCWVVNAMDASLAQHGGDVWGNIGNMRVEGTVDHGVFRLVWSRGAEYGIALLTVSADGQHLSAIKWHEEAVPVFVGDHWFGEKRPSCSEHPQKDGAVFETWMARAGLFPLYGLTFDESGDLLPASSATLDTITRVLAANAGRPLRFRGHGDPRQLESLRAALETRHADLASADFVQTDTPRRETTTECLRMLYRNIDLEIRR
jgi:hypothetical protein